MTYWISSSDASFIARESSELGGKGANLLWLKAHAIPVPVFGIVTSDVFDHWKRSGEFPAKLLTEMEKSMANWDCEHFAVRSSMSSEDGKEHSFAGIMESFLYVPREQIGEKIIACFESLFSDRAREYQRRVEVKEELRASVVVQAMAQSEVSGVAFSRAPTGDSALCAIESCWGLCEGLVSGKLDSDQFRLDRFGQVIEKTLKHKESYYDLDPEIGATKLFRVEERKRDKSSLSFEQLQDLHGQLMRLESLYGAPVDIEWTYEKGRPENLLILQIRPITKEFPPLHYYVDTNLAESYPGKSSPFTGSVIPVLYKEVFGEATRLLGASEKKVRAWAPIYESLVEYHGGHLYYNLQNYYSALSALPGGENNIRNWQRMVGGELEGIHIPYQKLEFNVWEKVKTVLSLVKMAIFHRSVFRKFYRKVEKIHKEHRQAIQAAENPKECANILKQLVSERVGFGLVAVNDMLIMLFLGLFEKRAKLQGLSNEDIVGYLVTQQELESLRPLRELESMMARFKNPQGLLRAFEESLEWESYSRIFQQLDERGFQEEVRELKSYLEQFGDRAFEELKFESLTFSESPREFLRLLQFVGQKSGSPTPKETTEGATGADQTNVFILHRLHQHIEQREKARLWRGRYHGLIRSAMLRMAELMGFEGDDRLAIFSLTLNDIFRYGSGDKDFFDLKESLHTEWRHLPDHYPELFCTDKRQEPYFLQFEVDDSAEIPQEGVLKGDGACEKTARGVALVLDSPREALEQKDLSNAILVTKNTDPGWVFIMSRCRGLVSEKGSLLSHTAIIGRELGLPTVVGIKQATKRLKTGQEIDVDGVKGEVRIVEST